MMARAARGATGTPARSRIGVVAAAAVWWAAPALPAPDAPVADAAMRGEAEVVRALLRDGADVNAAQGDGMTALHWAAERGDVEIAEMVMYAGANLEATTRLGGYTPLHLGARGGWGDVVAALLEAGGDPMARTTTGAVTPLHFAAASGSADAVDALARHGADVNATESAWGQTPLMFAAGANRLEAVRALLERGADVEVTAAVVDITAREEADRADQRRRGEGGDGAAAGAGPRARRPPASDRPAPPGPVAPQEQLRGGTEIDPLSYADLVGSHGGLTALLLAVREGHRETVEALLSAGAGIDRVSAGDRTSPILMASINGHFDLALWLLERGADPTLASDAGATPLYAVLNVEWAPKARHPQPIASQQQRATYLEVMEALLEAGADPNARLEKQLWFTTYNNDLLQVDRAGATPFWRAAYATDVEAMRLLVARGADPNVPTKKMPERRARGEVDDPSGLPPVPVGGPAVYPIHAATGAGYGEGFAANSHRHVPDGWLPAVRYLVEELGADVNARDHNGYAPLHHAAARGDNELILYLVDRGADVTAVSRGGQTTADMANGPVQRIQPFPETVALLERLGSRNNHNCVSC